MNRRRFVQKALYVGIGSSVVATGEPSLQPHNIYQGLAPAAASYPVNSYGPSAYDRTQVLVVSGTWELPFGPGKRWLNNGLSTWILGHGN